MLLQTPVTVNRLTLASRLVFPPMHTGKAEGGRPTEALIDHYVRRAEGGAIGLIVMEYIAVSRQGVCSPTQLAMLSDADVPAHRRLTDAIHAAGVPVFAQINHAGGAALPAVTGCEAVAPSAVAHPWAKKAPGLPRPMTGREIRAVEEEFRVAAARCRDAGYDGVELHAAHTYLLSQFYSPLFNLREDEYGRRSVEDRVRVITETLGLLRRELGAEYPLAVRLGGCDYAEGGSTLADCAAACRLLAGAGADLLDISGGACVYTNPQDKAPGYFRDASRAAKEAGQVPVLLTGGITEAAQAEALLADGAADLIGVGRALFRDAGWARRRRLSPGE